MSPRKRVLLKNITDLSHGINGYLYKKNKPYRNWSTNNGVFVPPKLSVIWSIMRLHSGIYHEGDNIFD